MSAPSAVSVPSLLIVLHLLLPYSPINFLFIYLTIILFIPPESNISFSRDFFYPFKNHSQKKYFYLWFLFSFSPFTTENRTCHFYANRTGECLTTTYFHDIWFVVAADTDSFQIGFRHFFSCSSLAEPPSSLGSWETHWNAGTCRAAAPPVLSKSLIYGSVKAMVARCGVSTPSRCSFSGCHLEFLSAVDCFLPRVKIPFDI